jgi:glycosyltransferase involved in cell wall biosynthesis
MLSALRRADADIYYQSCAAVETGVTAWFCKKNKRKFIFRVASDTDCVPGQQLISWRRDRLIYEYGLRHADIIATQGKHQSDLLKMHYGLPSIPVNMTVAVPRDTRDTPLDIDVLWVSNIWDVKRPELILDIARMLPDFRITMIGGPVRGYEKLYRWIQDSAQQIENVCFVGPVPYQEVDAYFSRARIFVNTSSAEGFPNTFLQAWARGVPVVSFFDPDGLIVDRGLGTVPTTANEMAEEIRRFLNSHGSWITVSNRSRNFVSANYSPNQVVGQYEQLAESLF